MSTPAPAALHRLREQFARLAPLSDIAWNLFTPLVEPVEYPRNELLISAGQIEQHIHFLTAGLVRVFLNKDGKEICLDFAFEGEFTSSYASFLTRQPSQVTLQALADTQTLRFRHDRLAQLYDASPEAERVGRRIAEQLYLRKTGREISFLTRTATERYGDLLHQHPALVQTIPVKYLASYLGIEPESLSRIRRAF